MKQDTPSKYPTKQFPAVRRDSSEVAAVREILKDSSTPKMTWVEALESEARRLREEIANVESRRSQADLDFAVKQAEELSQRDALLKSHDERLKAIEESSKRAEESSAATHDQFKGPLPPKVVMGIAALGALAQLLIELIKQIRGH